MGPPSAPPATFTLLHALYISCRESFYKKQTKIIQHQHCINGGYAWGRADSLRLWSERQSRMNMDAAQEWGRATLLPEQSLLTSPLSMASPQNALTTAIYLHMTDTTSFASDEQPCFVPLSCGWAHAPKGKVHATACQAFTTYSASTLLFLLTLST